MNMLYKDGFTIGSKQLLLTDQLSWDCLSSVNRFSLSSLTSFLCDSPFKIAIANVILDTSNM